MRGISKQGLTALEINSGCDVKVFGHGMGPKLSFDFKSHGIALETGVDGHVLRSNAWLKNANGFAQFFLQASHIRSRKSTELPGAKIDHGAQGGRVIL